MEDDQSVEKPYRAEYAKSGRSNCKSCKMSIEKDVLRLGVMVQSPVLDGKVPNWYHFTCFFDKQRPKTVDDFAHFDSLRWDDQEKLKEKLVEVANTAPATNGKGKKRGKKSDSDFSVEYAKSSRALCKGCEIKISKDEVRVSKKDFESDQGKKLGGLDRWYHLDCFVKLRTDLEYFDSGDTLPGFESLKNDDKTIVKTSLPKMDKGKVKDEVDGVPAKKIKTEDVKSEKKEDTKELDALMKKQNKLMFKYRDNLKPLTKPELSALLLSNNQDDPVGHDRKLDRLQDVMAFGALPLCTVCKTGKFIFITGVGYQCQGDMSEWSKCLHVEEKPKRKPFKIPEEMCLKYEFLGKYKCKLGDRAFKKVENVPKPVKVEASTSAKIERFAPFRGMVFFIIGRELKENKQLKSKIEKWGGTVTSKLTTDVVAVISTEGEIKKMSSKMSGVEEMKIHVVPESFVDACEKGDPIDKIKEMSISPWDSNDPKKTVDNMLKKSEALKSEALKSGGSRFSKSMSMVKLKIVDGSAVDPDSDMADFCHVLNDGKDIWSAVLGRSDVQTNKNSYYKIQLLEADDKRTYYVFRSWGRIGTKIGGKKLETLYTLKEAKKLFKVLYLDHSGNDWSDRHNFQKRPGLMYPIDIDYREPETLKKLSQESSIKSTLALPVQDLVKMIFDVEIMKKVMMEFELDMEKMPLGKLSRKQIQKAFTVLSELQGKDGDIKPKIITDASNRFYTLIPHNFGTQAPPLLDNAEIIQDKLSMLESLMEMEVAYGLLKEVETTDVKESVNPIDSHYAKLNTSIEVLERDSSEFRLIEKYVRNTHGKTHTEYSLDIVDVFKVKRSGESKKFKPFKKMHNRQLLWHGSRITNYVGILSQGLRIAPPEAPTTGYMFGKGVYFADMVSKSANYCMTSPSNPYGLILLCEVALGDMYERTKASYIEKLPKGKHSTKGMGVTMPDPTETETLEDGLMVPLGKPVDQFPNKSQTSLLYNEFIVYDVAQIQVHYLLKLKFNYKM